MKIGGNVENNTLQSLIKSSLLELNDVKLSLTEMDYEIRKEDKTNKIRELESIIVEKEKEVSLIKFKADEAVDILKEELEEKDREIQRNENKIYELNYVNTSLEEVKGYFANQLKEYKEQELSEINNRLNDAYQSIAKKDAQISNLSRQIDEYKIEIIKLENDVESQNKILVLEKEIEIRDNQIREINNQLNMIKDQSVPIEEYYRLKEELTKKDNKIKRLEEINEFFNELQEENEYYSSNAPETPPFRLDKQ
ncbi:MAG: glycosyl transferase [Methanobrevibacter sp.]|uniref:glycosyl transferase n=1 Tax=Methanobrevibacter sp. TaxID=66852 RepID=UPI0026DF2669|nr:glycosyl transferase [Methanobrevibacter sp.]MDO5848321.1 glycosyl transferase [Methanobrevibacter sp.]